MREADNFLMKYRLNHIDPMLMLEVKCWTVFCALLPTKSELEAVELFSDKRLYRNINKIARFKRSGQIEIDSYWCWPFGRDRAQLQMYTPRV
jgi:hypothetical protein